MCPGCNVEFFTFRAWNDYVRKSHCRKCGQVYCGACLEEVVRRSLSSPHPPAVLCSMSFRRSLSLSLFGASCMCV